MRERERKINEVMSYSLLYVSSSFDKFFHVKSTPRHQLNLLRTMSDPHHLNWNMSIALCCVVTLHNLQCTWALGVDAGCRTWGARRMYWTSRILIHSLEIRAPVAFLSSTASVPRNENAMNEFSLSLQRRIQSIVSSRYLFNQSTVDSGH